MRAVQVRRAVGWRGTALLVLAWIDAVYCWSLIDPPQVARRVGSLAFLSTIAPLWAWAASWGVVCVVCLIGAFLRKDAFAFTAAIGIKILWGGLLALAEAFGKVERGYVSATVFLALAVLVGLINARPEPARGAP